MWGWGNVYTEPPREHGDPGYASLGMRAAQAQSLEVELSREDPFGARDWDKLADARQAAWEASVFSAAFPLDTERGRA